ncbi:MAG: beta-lactamase family protein [Christensenellaceae bacterium]|jgi:CubicO group peptidase (beta-lactamase class C family)|nr:beta-lactamase family protein [Christensenellaceae bacterium]
MSDFYHGPSAVSHSAVSEKKYLPPMRAFLEFVNEEKLDLLYAQLRIDNLVRDDYTTHPLKTRLNVFTVSEGAVSLAVGIAIEEGLISLNDKICEYFPEYTSRETNENLQAVTLEHLLTMSTGVASSLFICDDAARYTVKDWMQCFFDAAYIHKPGTAFMHCNLNTYMICCMIEKKAGTNLLEYLRNRLFENIGIGNPDWLPCAKGHIMGFNGLYLTVEEMGMLGQLFLNKGTLNWHSIVPRSYISQAITARMQVDADISYGYHIWVPGHVPNTLLLKGRFGQGIIINADKNAVFTFQALEGYRYEEMFSKAVEFLQLL